MKLSDWFAWLKFKFGMMSQREVVQRLKSDQQQLIDQLPVDARSQIQTIYDKMDSLRSISDFPRYLIEVNNLASAFHDVSKRFSKEELGEDVAEKIGYIGGIEGSMYRPAGSRAWKFSINPFQVFSYYAEKHYATAAALDMIVSAASQRGYGYQHSPAVEESRVVQLDKDLKYLKIGELRLRLLKQFLCYGNCVVLPHYNFLGNLIRIEPLIMDRILPIIDKYSEEILGWDYWLGYTSTIYKRDQVMHLANRSLRHPEIGIPFLAPLAVDIESDIYASDFNQTVMFKGGMVGVIITTENTGTGRIAESRINARIKKELQDAHSGAKGANSIFVSNYIKDIKKLSQVGDFDASFLKFRAEVAKSIATIFQIDPALLNVGMKSAGVVEIGKIHSSRSAKMDTAVTHYMRIIDGFINREIIKGKMGIYDIEIESNGQYGTFSPESALALFNFSRSGKLFTINEARTYFAGMPACPPGDPRGNMLVDNSQHVLLGAPYESSTVEYQVDPNNTNTSEGEDTDGDDDDSDDGADLNDDGTPKDPDIDLNNPY